MANRRYIDFPIASTSGDTDIILIWQDGANKQTTKATFLGGLPENLEDLNDVVISGLTNGQILRYDSVTGKWENTDQGNLNLNDLNDVSIVSPSNGQVLVYNSSTSQWENSSGGYVPYVGAVTTVDLGAQGLRAGYVRFDTTVAGVPNEQGLMFWDADDETVNIILNGYTMKIGEDLFYPVKNQTGSTIAKGVAVRFNGTVGNSGRLLIAPFIADGSVASSRFMGVTAEEILNGEDGKVLYFGRVRGINTNAFNEGDILYASTTTAGGYQTAIPVAPNNIVQVAAVVTKSATVGTIFVRPTLGSNINKDEGVKIVSVADKNLLQYQSGTSLWENKTLAQVLGGTSAQFVKGDGSLDSTSYGTGTVTSVGLSSATSGVTIGSTPVTTSGTITLTIATASGSQNGLLSSTDWTTFNNKQNALTNPVTGTGTTNYLPKFTASTTIGNSNLINDASGNLGLGITPTNVSNYIRLQISGTTGAIFDLLSGSTRHFTIYNDSSSSIIGTVTNTPLIFQTNDGTKMTLTSGGNLLVGTTTDNGARLQVSGAIYSSDELYLDNGKYLRFRRSSGGLSIQTLGIPSGTDDVRLLTTGDFNVLNGSLTNLMTVKNGGNVLIGTTTDNGARLQVSGAGVAFNFTTSNGLIGNINSSATNGGYITWQTSGTTIADIGTAQQVFGTGGNDTFGINGRGARALTFGTNNTERMRITSSGNFGIGTSSPGQRLHVIDTQTSNTSILQLRLEGNGGNFYDIGRRYDSGAFVIQGNQTGFNNICLAPSGGNVLIGTTTDNGARLQVSGRGSFAGSSTVTGTVFISSGNQWSLNADQSGGGSPAFAGSGFYLRNENNSTIALGFNSGGAATFSSSVTANGGVITTGANGFRDTDGSRNIGMYSNFTGGLPGIGTLSNHDLGFFTNGASERMRITSGGSVGINNTSPVNTAWGNETNTKQLSIDATTYAVINLQGSTGRKYSMGVGDGNFYMCYDNTAARHNITVSSGGNVLINTTTSGSSKLRIIGLPTSAAGLSSGDVWSDSGTLKIA